MLNHTYPAFRPRRKPLCALIDALSSLYTSFPYRLTTPSNPSQPFSSSHLTPTPTPFLLFLVFCVAVFLYWCIGVVLSYIYMHTQWERGWIIQFYRARFHASMFFLGGFACLLAAAPPPFSSFFFWFLGRTNNPLPSLLSSSSSIQRGYVPAIRNLSCVGFWCMLGWGRGWEDGDRESELGCVI